MEEWIPESCIRQRSLNCDILVRSRVLGTNNSPWTKLSGVCIVVALSDRLLMDSVPLPQFHKLCKGSKGPSFPKFSICFDYLFLFVVETGNLLCSLKLIMQLRLAWNLQSCFSLLSAWILDMYNWRCFFCLTLYELSLHDITCSLTVLPFPHMWSVFFTW